MPRRLIRISVDIDIEATDDNSLDKINRLAEIDEDELENAVAGAVSAMNEFVGADVTATVLVSWEVNRG